MTKYTREIMDLLKNKFEQVVGNKNFQNGSEALSYYLADLEDNLCEPMGEKALVAYGKGSGNEIASGKMNALRSSSALTYNLFGNKPAKFAGKEYSVEFEKQYHTLKPSVSGTPANLDAFLYCEETAEAIACEMKMMEWIFNSPGMLKKAYLNPENYVNGSGDVFVSVAKELIADSERDADLEKYTCKMEKYDAFQMFKHAVACYSACCGEESREIKKLTLVNCVWTLPVPERLSPDNCRKYLKEEICEQREFEKFKQIMMPVKALFKAKGVEFNIEFRKFWDFLSYFDKTQNELDYLKRYTF